MAHFYPKIDEENVKLILQLIEQEADYLSSHACPYSDMVKNLFKPNGSMGAFNMTELDIEELSSEDGMLTEIMTIYGHLKQFGESMRSSDTASEKNTYFKLSATLLEKLINMKEKVINIQKMSAFSDTVLQIMEDELEPDTRTRIIEKLKKALDT